MLEVISLSAKQVVEGVLAELQQRYPASTIALKRPITQVVAADCDDHRDRYGTAVYETATILEFKGERWAFACHSRTDGYPADCIAMTMMALRLEGWLGCPKFTGSADAAIYDQWRVAHRAHRELVVLRADRDGEFYLRNIGCQLIPDDLRRFLAQSRQREPFGDSLVLSVTTQVARYRPEFVTFVTEHLIRARQAQYQFSDFPFVSII